MANKRSHNEGSIYRRPNGSWRAQVTLEGNRLSYNGRTKADCQVWIRKTLDQIDSGLTFDSAKITLEQFLNDWLISVENSLRPNTFKQYQQIVRNHIVPDLGAIKLKDLKPEHIQNRYNQMVASGKGLRTVQFTHAVLHRALVQAVQLGILPRNPDDATIPPKPKPKEMQFLDQGQVHNFLITAKQVDDPFYALYYLAIATGMRQAELLALKWIDLDVENGSLEIKRQLTRKKAGSFEFSQPKTKASKRKIALGHQTVQVLEYQRKKQGEIKVKSSERWKENDLIFTTGVGTFIDKYNLLRRFKKLLKQAGLPELRFHDLRHTAATLMLNNNVPVMVVSRRLGHARPSITLDVYGHLIPSKQQEAALLMDELLTPIEVQF